MNIATVSRDLRAQKQSEAELRHLNETLERRVSERTTELADTNEKLVGEIAERERADASAAAVAEGAFPCRASERGGTDGRRTCA